MVEVGVEVVDLDGVDVEDLEEGGVVYVDVWVWEGVVFFFGVIFCWVVGLVGYVDDLEVVVGFGVDEVLVFYFEGLEGGDGGGVEC